MSFGFFFSGSVEMEFFFLVVLVAMNITVSALVTALQFACSEAEYKTVCCSAEVGHNLTAFKAHLLCISSVLDIGRSVYHFCNIYTVQQDTQCSCTDCLLMLRCQLYMFRTVTVRLQELLCRYCMCRLWYVL